MTKIVSGYATKTNNRSARRFNLKYFNYGLYSVIAVLGLFYLVNISDLTVKGFALREYKLSAADLSSQNVEQEERANALQSYISLSTRTQKLSMVAVDNIEYLKPASAVVAKR